MNIFILTITDLSDFGSVLHHSVHSSYDSAQTNANKYILPILKRKIEPEYHDCLDVDITTMPVLTVT